MLLTSSSVTEYLKNRIFMTGNRDNTFNQITHMLLDFTTPSGVKIAPSHGKKEKWREKKDWHSLQFLYRLLWTLGQGAISLTLFL